jgi:hypothetical protein
VRASRTSPHMVDNLERQQPIWDGIEAAKVLTDTTQAWLLSLGRRLAGVEEDTPEGFEKRKRLVGMLVESVSLGRSQQDGRTEVRITYRFGPPDSASEPNALFVPHFKNGRESFTPDIDSPTLTVVAVR